MTASGVASGMAALTVGTAGHIDHGKTALVRALTGVDTDRLPEEKRRGITIALGYAALSLPTGRVLSLIDVPGHERLIRVMVSGATGIDLFLLVIAADDGVMPQTLEHIRVLKALAVTNGVVVITKSDLADPALAAAQAAELLPDAEIVACCAPEGRGLADVASALERVAGTVVDHRATPRAPVLHLDRVFTINGAGTVVTGTLWSGEIHRGDQLRLLPAGRPARVRGVQVHERAVLTARAGQRVAVNLGGMPRQSVARGDVLVGAGAPVTATYRIEAQLRLHEPLHERERVQIHHGTRSASARAVNRDHCVWQLRLEQPLIVADGDHVVVRRINPPDTLGGGVIIAAGRDRPRVPPTPRPTPPAPRAAPAPQLPQSAPPAAQPAVLGPEALALEQRLRAAGHEPLSLSALGSDAGHLPALTARGRAVRVGRAMYAHPDAVASVRSTVERIIAAEASITLGRLRDELDTSRRYAQALLEHLDAEKITRRRPDDSRVLRRRSTRGAQPAGGQETIGSRSDQRPGPPPA